MTWLGRTLQNVEIFAFVGSSIGVLHLHTIKSGDKPSPRRVRTEFWIGFVFCSPKKDNSQRRFELDFRTWAGCRYQWNMNIQEIVFSNSKFHLSKCFKEMHWFNITSGTAQFDNANLNNEFTKYIRYLWKWWHICKNSWLGSITIRRVNWIIPKVREKHYLTLFSKLKVYQYF